MTENQQKWLPFDEAREIIRSCGLKNQKDWNRFTKSGKLPEGIPVKPERVYKNKGWDNLGDWLGTGFIAPRHRHYRSYEQAEAYARSLKLKGKSGWYEHTKSGKLPTDIPSDPRQVYKNKGWKGWGDFLGTGNIAPQNQHYRKFEEARKFVQTQGIKSVEGWYRYCLSGKKPADIPSSPEYIYRNQGWKGMPDFLGAGRKVGGWLPFDEAKTIARGLGLKSVEEWEQNYEPKNNHIPGCCFGLIETGHYWPV